MDSHLFQDSSIISAASQPVMPALIPDHPRTRVCRQLSIKPNQELKQRARPVADREAEISVRGLDTDDPRVHFSRGGYFPPLCLERVPGHVLDIWMHRNRGNSLKIEEIPEELGNRGERRPSWERDALVFLSSGVDELLICAAGSSSWGAWHQYTG